MKLGKSEADGFILVGMTVSKGKKMWGQKKEEKSEYKGSKIMQSDMIRVCIKQTRAWSPQVAQAVKLLLQPLLLLTYFHSHNQVPSISEVRVHGKICLTLAWKLHFFLSYRKHLKNLTKPGQIHCVVKTPNNIFSKLPFNNNKIILGTLALFIILSTWSLLQKSFIMQF